MSAIQTKAKGLNAMPQGVDEIGVDMVRRHKATVWADSRQYVASESTFYRVLRAEH